MDTDTSRKITAQVAAEAIANDPHAYDPATIDAVRAEAIAAGVHPRYIPADLERAAG